MVDPRVTHWAKILVDHSMAVQTGDVVQIRAWSELARPLVAEIYRHALKRGAAEIIAHIELEELREIFLAEGSEDQLKRVSALRIQEAQYTDTLVEILAPVNSRLVGGTDPKRVALWESALGQVFNHYADHKRWVYTLYPTPSAAQDAGMALMEFEEFVFQAVDVDWAEFAENQKSLVDRFQGASAVMIKGPDTDLRMSVSGRTFCSADGRHEIPDGEVFTGPVEDSVEGHISFSYPAVFPAYGGQEVENVHLWFEQGRVVKATATNGEAYLRGMLDMDQGSRYVGELGIGTNFGIRRFVKNILFDEKIGGTVHIALGQSYAETGGKNESGLHWDMIKDLRQGGEIIVDGTPVQRDGQWLF
jgi:aminopeptidase